MKERPILFSAAMIRAILAGTKTQTRRQIKPQPNVDGVDLQTPPDQIDNLIKAAWNAGFVDVRCPYGQVGDRLWVRETWGFDSGVRHDFRPVLGRRDLSGMDLLDHVEYRADAEYGPCAEEIGDAPRWRPSTQMPRWASRITLEVTDVRVERLQNISDSDVQAEGIARTDANTFEVEDAEFQDARSAFAWLWQGNGKRAPWESDPWCWVVSFKRLEASHV